MRFYETKMGRAFFEHQVPQLITAVENLAAESRPVLSVTVPEADPKFLHDLFFSKYEPEVYQVTPEIQQLGRAVSSAHIALAETLSKEGKGSMWRWLWPDCLLLFPARRRIDMAKTLFHKPRCSICPYYGVHNESVPKKVEGAFLRVGCRYCSGGKRIRVFKRSDPKVYIPSWCPRHKVPAEMRVYCYKNTVP